MADLRGFAWIAVAGLAGAGLIGVAATAAAKDDAAESDGDRHALSHILARGALVDRELLYDDLTDLLPNVKYKTDDGPRAATEVVVHGKVSSVDPDYGFVVKDPAFPTAERLDFDDKNAMWRTVRLTVRVIDTLGPGLEVGPEIKVGLAVAPNASLETLQAGFASFDSNVFFLNHSDVFAYDPSLFYDVLDGSLITEVKDDRLFIPGLEVAGSNESDISRSYVSRTPTLTELKREATEPTTTRPLRPEEAAPVE